MKLKEKISWLMGAYPKKVFSPQFAPGPIEDKVDSCLGRQKELRAQ